MPCAEPNRDLFVRGLKEVFKADFNALLRPMGVGHRTMCWAHGVLACKSSLPLNQSQSFILLSLCSHKWGPASHQKRMGDQEMETMPVTCGKVLMCCNLDCPELQNKVGVFMCITRGINNLCKLARIADRDGQS